MKQDEGPVARGDSRIKPPNESQLQILEAYSMDPNAASVERQLGHDERHVRRVVARFPEVLDDLRRRREGEAIERARARIVRTQDWADQAMLDGLRRLDELTASESDGTALRAVKVVLDLALRDLSWTHELTATPSELERGLEDAHQNVVRRIREAGDGQGSDE